MRAPVVEGLARLTGSIPERLRVLTPRFLYSESARRISRWSFGGKHIMNTTGRHLSWALGAFALIATIGLGATQMAQSAQPVLKNIPPGKNVQRAADAPAPAALPAPCKGVFSDTTKINVANPTYLQDVPGEQLFCDFHTFAWNQFVWLTQMQADPNNGGAVTPLFLHMAPWYNVLKPNGSPQPGAYPGGSTALAGAPLDQGQAGDDDHLLDVKGATVKYDIRFNNYMYNAIAGGGLYTQNNYNAKCAPSGGNCTNPLWLPPTSVAASGPPTPGAMEIKSAWRDFGSAANCPATEFYCNGRFGLVGIHIVQKTQTHGEWIWASFEHVANDPDCYPGGDAPVAAQSPLGTPWSFFSPVAAGPSVMSTKMCEVTGTSPQCNANPKYYLSQHIFIYKPVNICRTDYVPAGGDSAANCTSVPDGPPQQSSNSPGNVACLNAVMMPQMSGVWKNYKMIGSLWVRGTTGPTTPFTVQIFQSQQTGVEFGQPVGFPHLANTMMETWMQYGSTGYDASGANSQQAGCFLCHNLPSAPALPGSFAADDLSHYPGKLPTATLKERLQQLIPADSTKVAAEQPMSDAVLARRSGATARVEGKPVVGKPGAKKKY
jgi:hypothetical protein